MTKSIVKTLSASAVAVGSVMGAGFSSGQEVNGFFRGQNVFLVFAATLAFFFGGLLLFMLAGNKCGGSLARLHKRTPLPRVFGGLAALSMFIVLCSMLSGLNAIFYVLFHSRLFALTAQLLLSAACAYVLTRGFKGVKRANLYTLPFAAIIIVALCLANPPKEAGEVSLKVFSSAALYCSMNTVFCAGTLCAAGAELSRKEIKAAALISAFALSTLLCILLLSLGDLPERAMPIFLLAKSPAAIAACFALLLISILTSLLSSAHGIFGSLAAGRNGVASLKNSGKSSALAQERSSELSKSGTHGIVGSPAAGRNGAESLKNSGKSSALAQERSSELSKSGTHGIVGSPAAGRERRERAGSGTLLIAGVFAAGNAVSLVGFDNIVKFVYPPMSAFCVVYVAAVFYSALRAAPVKNRRDVRRRAYPAL